VLLPLQIPGIVGETDLKGAPLRVTLIKILAGSVARILKVIGWERETELAHLCLRHLA